MELRRLFKIALLSASLTTLLSACGNRGTALKPDVTAISSRKVKMGLYVPNEKGELTEQEIELPPGVMVKIPYSMEQVRKELGLPEKPK
jgi:hypothetical protein